MFTGVKRQTAEARAEARPIVEAGASAEGRVDRTRAFGALGPADRARLGRLGGALFLAGSACSLPAGLVLQPTPAATSHLLGVAGMITGLIMLLAPWERLSSSWLHLPLVLGIAETAAGVLIFSDDFSFYYVVIGAYGTFLVRDRRVLALYYLGITVTLLAPLVYDGENTREQAHHILVTLPVFLIVSALVLYLRETLEEREDRYRRFAYEAVALATRIRGSRRSATDEGDDLDRRLDELARGAEGGLEEQAGAAPDPGRPG